MAGTASTKGWAIVVGLLALVVFGAGIAAAITYDDVDSSASSTTTTSSTSTTRPVTSSTTTSTTTTALASTTSTTSTTPGSTSTTTTVKKATTTTTAKPAVPTPEQAANGLYAAYRENDKAQAAKFATQPVIDTMFSVPYSPPDGTFQGCRPDGDLFRCSYDQEKANSDMTAQRSATTGSFRIVVISITYT